ncbi:MAG: histidine kinase [Alteromonadaceae bacterium]|nr:MAG: histidine kinase [Alteromonadaceae bacterium]
MNENCAKVLIVDDTPPNVDLLRNILSSLNYKISFSYDGHRALKIAPHFQPDLILLDVNMPGIDGFETCRQLKTNPLTQHIPIIFVTAHTESSALSKAFECGAIDYITKPIKESEVIARVKTQIELQRARNKLQGLYNQIETIARYNKLLLNSVADGIFSLNTKGNINFVNPAAETLLGWGQHELIEQSLKVLLSSKDSTRFVWEEHTIYTSCAQAKTPHCATAIFAKRDDSTFTVDYSASPLSDAEGMFTGAVVIFRDVTKQRALAGKIEHQATHDALTGLINRREFENQLQLLLTSVKEDKKEHVMMYMDLDQFKVVNDTCGHGAGDELLRQLSHRISETIRSHDTLARLGGDEFGVLLSNCAIKSGVRAAENILSCIQSFRLSWDSKNFTVGASIGIVSINEQCESIGDIMSQADNACYAAKEGGRNRIHIYDDDDVALQERKGDMQWVSRINNAIENNAFVIQRQCIVPVIATERFNFDHFEVLIRMTQGNDRLIPPGAFLPAAERYNLITNLDRWVVKSLFIWIDQNRHELADDILCSVNLSGRTVGEESFIEFLFEAFDTYKIKPSNICFEITETAAITNLALASNFISKLRDHGCYFALDDFGSGLSSYTYLKELPIDFIKIDGAFIKGIVHSDVDYAIVKSISDIGHILGKQTIAKFVENDEILEKLRIIGVDFAQGYGIDRPHNM